MPDLSNDRERIKKAIADQKEFTLLPNEEFHLLFESQDFPGAIVQFPDSPLRHLAVVRARIKEKPSSKKCQNSSNQSNASDSSAMLSNSVAEIVFNSLNLIEQTNFSEELDSSYTELQSRDTSLGYIGQELAHNTASSASQPKPAGSNCDDIHPETSQGFLGSGHASESTSMNYVPDSQSEIVIPPSNHNHHVDAHVVIRGHQTDTTAVMQTGQGCYAIGVRTDPLQLRPSNALIPNEAQTGPPTKKMRPSINIRRPDRNIPLSKFTWRTFFTSTINTKLQKFKELTTQEENCICRSLCEDVIQYTDCPDPLNLRNFVDNMFAVYPGLVGSSNEGHIETDKEKIEALKEVWLKRLSRLRSENGNQLPCGRPRKKAQATNETQRPARTVLNNEVQTTIDWVSYKENVTKMKSFHADAPSHPSLESLYQLTFEGRRTKLTLGEFDGSAFSLIKEECPLLAYKTYLIKEFDSILRVKESSAVKCLTEKWKQLFPKIITLANTQERSCKNIQNVLRQRSINGDETVALQLMVLFLPGKAKTLKGINYFIQIIEESENMTIAAERIPRLSPFIMKCGNTFHIVVDSKPIIHLSSDTRRSSSMSYCFILRVPHSLDERVENIISLFRVVSSWPSYRNRS